MQDLKRDRRQGKPEPGSAVCDPFQRERSESASRLHADTADIIEIRSLDFVLTESVISISNLPACPDAVLLYA